MNDGLDCVQCGAEERALVAVGSRRFACRRCDAVFSVGRQPLRLAMPAVVVPRAFRRRRWVAAYQRRSDQAVATVPLYRERSAPWRQPAEPLEVADLVGTESRICPFVRPWNPQREASLWIGASGNLLTVLRAAAPHLTQDTVVLEVRDSLLDRRMLGRHRYAVLLSGRAVVRSEHWRSTYNAGILARAAEASERVVVIGAPGDAHHGLLERDPLLGRPSAGAAFVHDPLLGYVAARDRRCGVLHVNWRDYHVRVLGDQLVWTDLRRTRPTLVDILAGSGRVLGECPRHRVPALLTPGDR